MTFDVDRLISVAMQLAGRVRDDDPDANQRWLHASTTPEEREALLYVLAAAVPVDVETTALYEWACPPPVEPCGTRRGPHHHRKAGEPVCAACKRAAAAYERERSRVRRRDQVSGRQRAPLNSGGDGVGDDL